MEEGILSRKLALDCGQGNGQEKYATKRQRCTDAVLCNDKFINLKLLASLLKSM